MMDELEKIIQRHLWKCEGFNKMYIEMHEKSVRALARDLEDYYMHPRRYGVTRLLQ